MKICYINFNLDNPRDQITLRGLRENDVTVTEISDNTPGLIKYLRIARAYRADGKDCDVVMIGFAGGILVPFMRLLTRKKIIYNAVSSFYDSMIVSRQRGESSLAAVGYYLLDYLSFHIATHSCIECQSQKDLVIKRYRVDPRKISVQLLGADDHQFYADPAIPKLAQFTVVFRGMFLPEAGADVAIRAAKELEVKNISVRIIGRGLLRKEVEDLIRELRPTNLELITEKLPIETLRRKMLECHVSLGQLADHPRVHTTIPHKAFESMAMKISYLTGDNKGVMEILVDNQTCFTIPPGDHHALARKILELRERPQELERVAENAYQLYLREFTPKMLAQKILAKISV